MAATGRHSITAYFGFIDGTDGNDYRINPLTRTADFPDKGELVILERNDDGTWDIVSPEDQPE